MAVPAHLNSIFKKEPCASVRDRRHFCAELARRAAALGLTGVGRHTMGVPSRGERGSLFGVSPPSCVPPLSSSWPPPPSPKAAQRELCVSAARILCRGGCGGSVGAAHAATQSAGVGACGASERQAACVGRR